MTSEDLLTIAAHLVERANAGDLPPDAAHRVAIGRSYYAVFLAALPLAERRSPSPRPSGPEIHRWVADQFRGSSPEERTVYSELARLRNLRNAADYGDPMNSAELSKAVRKIVRRLMTALGTLDRRDAR